MSRTGEMENEEEMAIYANCDPINDPNTQQGSKNTGCGSVKIRFSRAASVCLVLVCVLLTTVIVLSVYNYTITTNCAEEREWLISSNTDLTKERNEQQVKITNLTEERKELLINWCRLIQIANLTEERKELLNKDKWIYNQFSFYYMSTEEKTWSESRRYCTDRGADLVIINNREEQGFIKKQIGNDEFWIGLTEADVEGSWKWVDGTTLNSGFWESGEPNRKTRNKHGCALNYSPGWFDFSCTFGFRWICEMRIKT